MSYGEKVMAMNFKAAALVNASRAILLALFLLAACQRASAPPISSNQQRAALTAWDAYATDFLETYFVAQPALATWAGRHEFDGMLPDWSAAGIRREIQRLHAQRDRAIA